jgi:hypothetical protein
LDDIEALSGDSKSIRGEFALSGSENLALFTDSGEGFFAY